MNQNAMGGDSTRKGNYFSDMSSKLNLGLLFVALATFGFLVVACFTTEWYRHEVTDSSSISISKSDFPILSGYYYYGIWQIRYRNFDSKWSDYAISFDCNFSYSSGSSVDLFDGSSCAELNVIRFLICFSLVLLIVTFVISTMWVFSKSRRHSMIKAFLSSFISISNLICIFLFAHLVSVLESEWKSQEQHYPPFTVTNTKYFYGFWALVASAALSTVTVVVSIYICFVLRRKK